MAEEIPEKDSTPEHLDYWSRNDRLYKTLLSFGLWVEPVLIQRDGFTDIDYLKVSIGQPAQLQDQG